MATMYRQSGPQLRQRSGQGNAPEPALLTGGVLLLSQRLKQPFGPRADLGLYG